MQGLTYTIHRDPESGRFAVALFAGNVPHDVIFFDDESHARQWARRTGFTELEPITA